MCGHNNIVKKLSKKHKGGSSSSSSNSNNSNSSGSPFLLQHKQINTVYKSFMKHWNSPGEIRPNHSYSRRTPGTSKLSKTVQRGENIDRERREYSKNI